VGEAAQTRTPDTQLFLNAFNASPIGIADRAPGTAPTKTVPLVCDVA